MTWRSWDRKSSSGELPLHEAIGALGHLVGVHGALGLFDQAEHVPHAQDAVGHAVRVEQVEVGEALTGAGEGDRLAHDTLHRERGPATGVAVELGQDDATQFERVVEGLRRRHGVLADHGVDHQERVVRLGGGRDVPDLLHEIGVNGQAARGVDDADVTAEAAGLLQAGPGAGHRVGGLAEDGHPGLLPEHPQLFHGGGPLQVGADEERVATLLLPPQGELGGGGGLAGALQAGHEDDRRRPRRVAELECLAAEHPDQLLVHGADDLLARGQALGERLGADPEPDAVAEASGDGQLDVGLQERGADLLERLVEVRVADAPLAAQAGRDALQAVGEGVEHGYSG